MKRNSLMDGAAYLLSAAQANDQGDPPSELGQALLDKWAEAKARTEAAKAAEAYRQSMAGLTAEKIGRAA